MKRICSLCLLLVALFARLEAQTPAFQLTEEGLKTYLSSQDFSGVVLLKKADGEVVEVTHGTVGIENETPIETNDARYRIASITKLFTAAIIMQLIDEGKIELDQPISELLPYEGITYADQITIRHLLQHTSGLSKESNVSYLKQRSPDELIEKFAYKKAKAPGEDMNYNNVDFLLLGKVIEAATGKSFEQNLKSRIIEPLNLSHSGLVTPDNDPKLVESYVIKKSKRANEVKISLSNFWAAGSMYSRPQDLLIFADALKSDKLLSENAKKALFESRPDLGYVALGCWTFSSPFIEGTPRVMERRGEILGATSVVMTHLDGPETVIIISNTNSFNPDSFGDSGNIKEFLFAQLFTRQSD